MDNNKRPEHGPDGDDENLQSQYIDRQLERDKGASGR